METIAPTVVEGENIIGQAVELRVESLVWRPAVYGIVIDDDGHMLALDNTISLNLELPGGGVEMWETVEAALHREIWEETGLKGTINELIHADDSFFLTPNDNKWHTLRLYYLVTATGGALRSTIIDDEPCTNPKWIPLSEIVPSHFQLGHEAIQLALQKLGQSMA